MGGEFLLRPAFMKCAEARGMSRARWRSEGELIYRAADGRVFVVPRGFETDFASVPRLPLAYWLAGDTAHLSACLHDYLCRVKVAEGAMSWREAADIFLEAMAAEGVPAWRRALMYRAVRHLGGPARFSSWSGPDAG